MSRLIFVSKLRFKEWNRVCRKNVLLIWPYLMPVPCIVINALNVFHYSAVKRCKWLKGKRQEENTLQTVPNSTCPGSLQMEVQALCFEQSDSCGAEGFIRGTQEGPVTLWRKKGEFTDSTAAERPSSHNLPKTQNISSLKILVKTSKWLNKAEIFAGRGKCSVKRASEFRLRK